MATLGSIAVNPKRMSSGSTPLTSFGGAATFATTPKRHSVGTGSGVTLLMGTGVVYNVYNSNGKRMSGAAASSYGAEPKPRPADKQSAHSRSSSSPPYHTHTNVLSPKDKDLEDASGMYYNPNTSLSSARSMHMQDYHAHTSNHSNASTSTDTTSGNAIRSTQRHVVGISKRNSVSRSPRVNKGRRRKLSTRRSASHPKLEHQEAESGAPTTTIPRHENGEANSDRHGGDGTGQKGSVPTDIRTDATSEQEVRDNADANFYVYANGKASSTDTVGKRGSYRGSFVRASGTGVKRSSIYSNHPTAMAMGDSTRALINPILVQASSSSSSSSSAVGPDRRHSLPSFKRGPEKDADNQLQHRNYIDVVSGHDQRTASSDNTDNNTHTKSGRSTRKASTDRRFSHSGHDVNGGRRFSNRSDFVGAVALTGDILDEHKRQQQSFQRLQAGQMHSSRTNTEVGPVSPIIHHRRRSSGHMSASTCIHVNRGCTCISISYTTVCMLYHPSSLPSELASTLSVIPAHILTPVHGEDIVCCIYVYFLYLLSSPSWLSIHPAFV